MVRDPVCGMMVDEKNTSITYEYKGTVYYFCAPGCKAAFEKAPERYLAEGGTGTMHHGHGGHKHHHG